jgi:hypothetical protein
MGDLIDANSENLWFQYMREGNFEAAWKFSDKVMQERRGKPCWHLPRHLQYCWNGESLTGKRVLVRCYHGLGDTIQFIRYIPALKKNAAEVIVWAQPSLISILQSINEIDKLIPLHDGCPDADFDADIEIMELPHYFRTKMENIPNNTPYLETEPYTISETKELKAGLIWQSGAWDVNRSVPFNKLLPLFKLRKIKFSILQDNAEKAGWVRGYGEYTGSPSLMQFARIIKGLDLLITIDSMPSHLAGALGVPVWTLLQKNADWRWMHEREDSPWYPTMRLFRQKEQGEWNTVIADVKKELKILTSDFSTNKVVLKFAEKD